MSTTWYTTRRDRRRLKERELVTERGFKCKGTAKVRLEVLYFPPLKTRDPKKQEKNIERLKKAFRDEGCLRLPLENHIPAVITQQSLDAALQLSKVSGEALRAGPRDDYQKLEFPPCYRLECLDGRSRALAAAAPGVLPLGDKTWTVDLYLADITQELRTVLIEEYSNEDPPHPGELYRKLRLYQLRRDLRIDNLWFAKRCLARLSNHGRRNVEQLKGHDDIQTACDDLLDVFGLWKGWKTSTWNKAFGMKVDEYILNYIDGMVDFWSGIFGHKGGKKEDFAEDTIKAMQKIDEQTVKAIEQKAPGACRADAQKVYGNLKSGKIFGAFSDQERETIWEEVCSRTKGRLIPSFSGLFEDLNWLKEPADCVKRLIRLPPGETIFSVLEGRIFTDVNQQADQCMIQRPDNTFISWPGTKPDRLKLGVLQIFLIAIRDYLDMPVEPRKKNLLAKSRSKKPDAKVLHDFAVNVYRLGFESDKIHDLMEYPVLPSETQQQMSPSEPEHSDPTIKRRGIPWSHHHEQDKPFLYLENLHAANEENLDELTSFFVRRSVILAFFGQLLSDYLKNGVIHPQRARVVEHQRQEHQRQEPQPVRQESQTARQEPVPYQSQDFLQQGLHGNGLMNGPRGSSGNQFDQHTVTREEQMESEWEDEEMSDEEEQVTEKVRPGQRQKKRKQRHSQRKSSKKVGKTDQKTKKERFAEERRRLMREELLSIDENTNVVVKKRERQGDQESQKQATQIDFDGLREDDIPPLTSNQTITTSQTDHHEGITGADSSATSEQQRADQNAVQRPQNETVPEMDTPNTAAAYLATRDVGAEEVTVSEGGVRFQAGPEEQTAEQALTEQAPRELATGEQEEQRGIIDDRIEQEAPRSTERGPIEGTQWGGAAQEQTGLDQHESASQSGYLATGDEELEGTQSETREVLLDDQRRAKEYSLLDHVAESPVSDLVSLEGAAEPPGISPEEQQQPQGRDMAEKPEMLTTSQQQRLSTEEQAEAVMDNVEKFLTEELVTTGEEMVPTHEQSGTFGVEQKQPTLEEEQEQPILKEGQGSLTTAEQEGPLGENRLDSVLEQTEGSIKGSQDSMVPISERVDQSQEIHTSLAEENEKQAPIHDTTQADHGNLEEQPASERGTVTLGQEGMEFGREGLLQGNDEQARLKSQLKEVDNILQEHKAERHSRKQVWDQRVKATKERMFAEDKKQRLRDFAAQEEERKKQERKEKEREELEVRRGEKREKTRKERERELNTGEHSGDTQANLGGLKRPRPDSDLEPEESPALEGGDVQDGRGSGGHGNETRPDGQSKTTNNPPQEENQKRLAKPRRGRDTANGEQAEERTAREETTRETERTEKENTIEEPPAREQPVQGPPVEEQSGRKKALEEIAQQNDRRPEIQNFLGERGGNQDQAADDLSIELTVEEHGEWENLIAEQRPKSIVAQRVEGQQNGQRPGQEQLLDEGGENQNRPADSQGQENLGRLAAEGRERWKEIAAEQRPKDIAPKVMEKKREALEASQDEQRGLTRKEEEERLKKDKYVRKETLLDGLRNKRRAQALDNTPNEDMPRKRTTRIDFGGLAGGANRRLAHDGQGHQMGSGEDSAMEGQGQEQQEITDQKRIQSKLIRIHLKIYQDGEWKEGTEDVDPSNPSEFMRMVREWIRKDQKNGWTVFVRSRMITPSTKFEDIIRDGNDTLVITSDAEVNTDHHPNLNHPQSHGERTRQ